jgi:putative transposase
VHVVTRCNNLEFAVAAEADFEVLVKHLREMSRTYDVPVYAYTLMSNHLHLLLQAPKRDALGRRLRWFMTETAKAFPRTRRRRGHFWERRYYACVVEGDACALAALRYLDRNPVRAGLIMDPAAYPWSSCAAYALGAPNPVIAFHPSYRTLSLYPKVRQRHYRTLVAPSADAVADGRDRRWTTQRAVGSPAFVARYAPRHRGRPRLEPIPSSNQEVAR